MKFLDSTFLIDLLRGKPETLKVADCREPMFTSQLNMYEIIKGIFLKNVTSSKIPEIMEIFNTIKVIPFDDNALIKSAEIFSDLTKKGLDVHNFDCMAAGCALSRGVNVIVTRNVEHFKRIKGLKVEPY